MLYNTRWVVRHHAQHTHTHSAGLLSVGSARVRKGFGILHSIIRTPHLIAWGVDLSCLAPRQGGGFYLTDPNHPYTLETPSVRRLACFFCS